MGKRWIAIYLKIWITQEKQGSNNIDVVYGQGYDVVEIADSDEVTEQEEEAMEEAEEEEDDDDD